MLSIRTQTALYLTKDFGQLLQIPKQSPAAMLQIFNVRLKIN